MQTLLIYHGSHAAASVLPSNIKASPAARWQGRRPRPRRYTNAIRIVASVHNKPLVVVGSVNADMMLQVDRFPKPGETLSAKSMTTSAGGKVSLFSTWCYRSMCALHLYQLAHFYQLLICREPIRQQLQLA